MRWTAAAVLRPITFVLAIVAAVLVGNRTDSFWYGLLAWFIAMGAGPRGRRARSRAASTARSTKRSGPRSDRLRSALRHSGLPPWAKFFVAFIAASLTKSALRGVVPAAAAGRAPSSGARVDLDELLP